MAVRLNFFALTIVLYLAAVSSARDCPIVPTPKEYKPLGGSYILGTDTVIVIGNNATQVDEYAAERLQYYVSKRFSLKLEIKRQSAIEGIKSVILLGTRQSCAKVEQLCRANKIALDANTPGFDGYIIETLKNTGGFIVLIGGSNERGVTYGMSSFFNLLTKDNSKVVFPAVSIRDWPTIKWRGKTCGCDPDGVDDYIYDVYVRSRLNYVDTLYPMVGLDEAKQSFIIDRQRVANVLTQAHRRGLFVFGLVSCAVKPDMFDQVYNSYEKLLDMGVDGIWLSFDDAGEGVGAEMLVNRIMELAKKRSLPDHAVMMTPPLGSYHNIETSWNKFMATQDNFDNIVWFFTRPPCDCDLQAARKIGLKTTLPAWWHNWPRPISGLLSAVYSGASMYNKQPYFELFPLEIGWHMPTYSELADADKYTDTVVVCIDKPWAEYRMPIFGYWAWDPAGHNWDAVRKAIYSDVYGPAQADDAKTFDDNFSELKNMFTHTRYKSRPPQLWPPRFIDPKTKPKAIEYVNAMDAALKKLKANAPPASLLDTQGLETYLGAMQDAVDYGRKLTNLEYPEYWLADFDESMISLVKSDPQAAAKRIEEVKPKIAYQLELISKELKDINGVDEYIVYWQQKLSGVDYWKKQIESKNTIEKRQRRSRQQMAEIWQSVPKTDYTELLAAQGNRPAGRVLIEKTAAQLEQQGSYSWAGQGWAMGLVSAGKREAFAIQFDGPCNEGDYKETAELKTEIVVPQHKGRLKVAVFVTHQFEDKNNPPARNERFSVIQLGRKWVWAQDSTNSMKGHEWAIFDLIASDDGTVKPGETKLISLKVYNAKTNSNLKTTALFGPVLVIEETK